MPGRRRIIRSPPESPPIAPAAVPADPAPVIAISDDEAAPAQPSQSAADVHPSAPAHSALLQNLSDSESDGSSSWADELEEAEQQQSSAVPSQIPPNFSRNLPRAPYRWANPSDEVAFLALEAQALAPSATLDDFTGALATMVALMTANVHALSQSVERKEAAQAFLKSKKKRHASKHKTSAAAAAAQEVYSVEAAAAAEAEASVAADEAEAPAATGAEAAAEADAKTEAAAEAAAAAKSRLRAARAAKAAKRAADADAAAAAAARDDAALAEAAQQQALSSEDDVQVLEPSPPVGAVKGKPAATATTPPSPPAVQAQARVPVVPAVKVNHHPPHLPPLPPLPQMTFRKSVGAEAAHTARLHELQAHGWLKEEAVAALAATAVEGLESTAAANEHLLKTSQTPLREAVAHLRQLTAPRRLCLPPPPSPADDAIAADSHLGQFISEHPESVVAGIYLRAKHRGGIHTGRPGSNVANLLASAAGYVQQLEANGMPYRVEDLAAAICADCSTCNAQSYADAAKRDAQYAATQAAAAPAPAPATATMPAPTPFSARASARDRRLPVTECHKCGIGQLPGGAGKTCLYFCSPCGRGWHKKCAQLTHLSEGIHDDGHWACPECLQEHSRRQDHGQPPAPLPQRPTPLRDPASRILFAFDPSQAEPDALNQFEGVGPLLRHYGRQQDAHRMHQQQILHRQARLEATPINDGPRTPMPCGGGVAGGWGDGLYPTPGGFQPHSPQSALGEGTGSGNITKTQVKIENYYQWPKLPSVTTADDLRTKGNSKEAYLNWKEINIPRRDQAKSNGGDLGPLAKNAFTPLMKLDVASSIVDDKRVQPEPNMSKEALARWINGDPLFSWFEFLPDKLLLEVLDSKHKVANPDGLFRRRMAPIPQMVANELNYAPDKFGAFCGEWIAEYSELVVSGWNPASIDCKALFLEAIDGHTLVANEAKRCSETNVILLIAHLRTWVQAKFTDTQNAIKEREAAAKSAVTTKPTSSLTESKAAKALLSRVDALEKAKKQDPADPKVWMCDGCGNSYSDTSKARKPPCRPKCVYFEHVGFNKTKKPWDPALAPLTWKNYPHEYPASFQAYCDKRDAKKRSARGDAAPPQKKQHTTTA